MKLKQGSKEERKKERKKERRNKVRVIIKINISFIVIRNNKLMVMYVVELS